MQEGCEKDRGVAAEVETVVTTVRLQFRDGEVNATELFDDQVGLWREKYGVCFDQLCGGCMNSQ
jgi:hypothetical protein